MGRHYYQSSFSFKSNYPISLETLKLSIFTIKMQVLYFKKTDSKVENHNDDLAFFFNLNEELDKILIYL